MAKRKLSDAQRAALKRSVKAHLRKGTKTSEILSSLSKKYGISSESIRWYLKAAGPKPKKRKAAKPKKGKKRRAAKNRARKVAHRAAAKPFSNGALGQFVAKARKTAKKTFERAAEMKKLLPKLESDLELKKKLETKSRQIGRTLSKVSDRVRKLRKSIAGLLG